MSVLGSQAAAFKDAFYGVAVTLFAADPKVLVSFGHPGTQYSDDMILFLNVSAQQQIATMSTTNRSREETLTLDIFISSFRNGETDNDKAPSDRVYALLDSLSNYVRKTDTTLGGVVRESYLTSHQSAGSTDQAVLGRGRMVDCVAQFTAIARITN